MICGKWLEVKEVLTLEVGNIKSRDLCVPLEVFGLGDNEAWRNCRYINVEWGNWK